MTSLAQVHDERFDEAEADVDHGDPWYYREPDAPNPLTILATGWSTGHTKKGEAQFLNGIDRDGKQWSILVGNLVLTKRLIEGLVEKWDANLNEFVVTDTLGRVKPGEVVSIKYIGDVQGAQHPYPNFRVSRRPAVLEPNEGRAVTASKEEEEKEAAAGDGDGDIPF
jgi:hypothetical protein